MSLKSAFEVGKRTAENHLQNCASIVSLDEQKQSLQNIKDFAEQLEKACGSKIFVHSGAKLNGTQTLGHYINIAERTYPHRNIMVSSSKSGTLQVDINQTSATTNGLKGSLSCSEEQALELMASWIGTVAPGAAAEVEIAVDAFEMSLNA